MRLKFLLIGLLLATPVLAVAQRADVSIDYSRLERLFDLQLKGSKDPTLTRRIEVERAGIRGLLDDQLNDLVNAFSREGTGGTLTLSTLVSQQKALVTSLQTRLDATEGDLDLLANEEEHFYKNPDAVTGALLEESRLTTSEANLLARKAVLEEQQKSLDFFLSLEKGRLNTLIFQQRIQQFSLLITIGKYILLFLIVIVIERIVRTRFLIRIQSQNARYVSMKLFTASIYAITALWIVAQVSSEYPGILTSVAILGAGVAISLQDVFKDIVGWIVIMQKRLYTLGDRITIGQYTGDVVDIGLLATTLLEVSNTVSPEVARSGQVLSVPNAFVLNQAVLNYSATSDYVDGEIVFTLTLDSNLVKAEETIKVIVDQETQAYVERARRQAAGRIKQFYSSHEPLGSRLSFEPSLIGILVTLRFPVPIGQRRTVVTRLTQHIVSALRALDDVHFSVNPHAVVD